MNRAHVIALSSLTAAGGLAVIWIGAAGAGFWGLLGGITVALVLVSAAGHWITYEWRSESTRELEERLTQLRAEPVAALPDRSGR